MGRRAKTNRVPATRAGNTWTEAAFWGFIRSGLRRMSKRWPPIATEALVAARRPAQSDNKRLKWEYCCASCSNWFPRDKVHVDHIEACGSLRGEADLLPFFKRLFCESVGLRVLCVACHDCRRHETGKVTCKRKLRVSKKNL